MINPSFEELKKIDESRYLISMVLAQRARRLVKGSKPLIETKSKKPVTIAIEELMAGKLSFETDDQEK